VTGRDDAEERGVVVDAGLFRRRGRKVAVGREAAPEPRAPAPRPLAVARTLALGHEIARLIADGTFADQADAARALGFTRARISQILDLTLLAPAIQEEILFAEVGEGRDPVTERGLRAVVAAGRWRAQRHRADAVLATPRPR